jgi:hypothetical protein
MLQIEPLDQIHDGIGRILAALLDEEHFVTRCSVVRNRIAFARGRPRKMIAG